ncbi:MAG: AbrB/MazE/SpoVT family DNA-binding domain-containing protein [Betaproteobacteria bacterium]|jgi:AbrB family looped-hinge helix DNA binding protein
MTTATVTSKRQITIPSDVCQRPGVAKGDRVEFIETESGEFLLRPVTMDITSLKGMIRTSKRGTTLADMDAAIAKAATSGALKHK